MIRTLILGILAWVTVVPASVGATFVGSMADISYWVGSGENQAVLIIDWQDGKNAPGQSAGQAIAWGYRWPSGQTRTGMQMLLDIAAADPRLVVDTMHAGLFLFGIGYDLDGDGGTFTFAQWEENGSASDPDDHFREGIEVNGFWGYKTGETNGTALPTFAEPEGENGFKLAAFNRNLVNGSWDAWVFSDFPLPPYPIPDVSPALAAVPEPSMALVLGTGGLALAGLRRRRR